MARIKQAEIIEHFKNTFVTDVMTDSEYKQWYKMQAFKLKNLRKVVKNYIEESGIKTDKSVDEIIMQAITYGGMCGCKWNTIASVGYKMLPKSITYWAKMEEYQKQLEEKAKQKEKEESFATVVEQKAIENNQQMQQTKKVPKWFTNMDEE